MPGRRTLDPYAVLGVARDATPLQVARAHRHLAKRHHPDLHEGATDEAERMRRINEAWAILSNPSAAPTMTAPIPTSATLAGGHWGRVPLADPAAPRRRRRAPGQPGGRPPPRRGPRRGPSASPERSRSLERGALRDRRPCRADLPRLGLGSRAGGGAHLVLLLGAIVVGRLSL